MDNGVIVNTSNLREVASSIIAKKDEIMDIYNNSIIKLVTESEAKLTNKESEIIDIEESLKKLFLQFDTNVAELTYLLTNKIIPNYDNLSNDVKSLFNDKFANRLNDLLKIDSK